MKYVWLAYIVDEYGHIDDNLGIEPFTELTNAKRFLADQFGHTVEAFEPHPNVDNLYVLKEGLETGKIEHKRIHGGNPDTHLHIKVDTDD